MARKAKGSQRTPGQILLRALLFVYAVLMLWLLFGQRLGTQDYGSYTQQLADNLNLEPLKTVRLYLHLLEGSQSAYLVRHAFVNLVGNVVMFVPLGYLLCGVYPKQRNFFFFLLCVTAMILVVEGVQYVTLLGSCDVDDLILNLAGAIMGWCIRKWIRFRK